MKRAYADTPSGQVHYVTAGVGAGIDAGAGAGDPVLLLHHTPRSWTFYRLVIPLLAEHHRVIAMDTLGFGNSDPPPSDFTAGTLAANVVEFLDAIGVDSAAVLGSMTGARLALDVAFRYGDRVSSLVLIAPPFFPSEAARVARLTDSGREHMGAPEPDGSHVVKLWRYVLDNLAAVEPGGSHVPGMYVSDGEGPGGATSPISALSQVQLQYLHDWMIDTLTCGDLWPRTAKAVYTDDLTDQLRTLTVPTLVIGGTGLGFPPFIQAENSRRLHQLIAGSRFEVIDAPTADSRVTYFHADRIAELVHDFLPVL